MTTRAETPTRSHAAASHKAAAAEKAKDALTLLKEEHRHVEELFEQFESARKPERKQQILQTLCAELTVHAMLEETHFYPAVREVLKKDEHLLDEAEVEHAGVKALVAQLEAESPDAELYEAKVTVLKEYVQHHVKEEEKQMFPRIRKSALDTAALGVVLQQRKQELQQQMRPH